jgi:hypothetical protein
MRCFVRSSAFAIAAVLGAAAVYAAWHSGRPLRPAKSAAPHVAAIMIVPAASASDPQAGPTLLGSPHWDDAHCELIGCADALAADASEFCSACLDPPDLTLSALDRSVLDESGASLAETSLGAFAPEFQGDPTLIDLVSFEPSATAAATPEISTAAMLTVGFAGVVWTAWRARRPRLRPDPAPRPC